MRISAQQARRLEALRNRHLEIPSASKRQNKSATSKKVVRNRKIRAEQYKSPPDHIRLIVPGPAVPKERARVVTKRGGGTMAYTPKRTSEYATRVAKIAVEAMKGFGLMQGPIMATLTFVMPIPKNWPKWKKEMAQDGAIAPTARPDVDNLAKNVFDALNEVVFQDDSQIVSKHLTKVYGMTPCTHILIRSVEALSSNVTDRKIALERFNNFSKPQ